MSVVSVALAAGVLVGVLVHPTAGWTRVSRRGAVARSAPQSDRSARETVPGVARARVTPGGSAGEGDPRSLRGLRSLVRWVLRRRGAVGPELGIVCASVAARVRSGQEPGAAWASELGVSPESGGGRRAAVERVRVRSADPGVDGVALVGSERAGAWRVGTTVPAEGLPPELLALVGRSPGADAAYVATRVALRSGAPLADVLDAVAVAVAEAEAAEADRRRARAGPASTARLLGWLPLGALLLGAGFGADPVAVVLEGGPGLLAMVAGVLLMVAGRWWSARLVRAATVDHDGPATRARG